MPEEKILIRKDEGRGIPRTENTAPMPEVKPPKQEPQPSQDDSKSN